MSTSSSFARRYLDTLKTVLDGISDEDLAAVLDVFEEALDKDRRLFIAGNGGSAATASHMVNDLLHTMTKHGGKGLRAFSLSDNAQLLTAIGNDVSYDQIFARQLASLADPEDILVVFSGSGKSPNLLHAVTKAKELKIPTIGFLGMDGGMLKDMVDHSVIVPSDDYGHIEDVHLVFNHLITEYLMSKGKM